MLKLETWQTNFSTSLPIQFVSASFGICSSHLCAIVNFTKKSFDAKVTQKTDNQTA